MSNGGANSAPPSDSGGGEFLLSLLHRRPYNPSPDSSSSSSSSSFSLDPAIAAVGRTVNHHFPPPPPSSSYNGPGTLPPPPWSFSPPNNSPNLLGFSQFPIYPNQFEANQRTLAEDGYRLGFNGAGTQNQKLVFGSFSGDSLLNGNFERNTVVSGSNSEPNLAHFRSHEQQQRGGGFSGRGNYGAIGNNNSNGGRGLVKSSPNPPPGFSSNQRGWDRNHVDLSGEEERLRRMSIQSEGSRFNLGQQIDHPGPPMGAKSLHSVSGADATDSFSMLKKEGEFKEGMGKFSKGNGDDEIEEFRKDMVESLFLDDEDVVTSLLMDNETEDKDGKKSGRVPREKESRNDNRGQWLLGQRLRMAKRFVACRNDIHRYDAPFIGVFKSLIPAEEELEKQRQLMAQLDNLVAKEWPKAKLYLYGSCANSFGFSKSDIDVCLAIEDDDVNKPEMLLKLADILESDNFQNVQALTRARVPIVKLMDPVTGISCDICINNVLAVVNTKLLRDYARIDGRLRQLAFIVKHWAKSRKVNETYHGTLSSYAYVIMCIHFLQMRRPPILPCLQEMEPTYSVRVDNVRCSYFDNVERLSNFGSNNRETIAELVWGFFSYWAYAHDYANTVVSVRTASILGKREKDWTRRVGNDRHLICIEDPFETSHDLGRVVDKFSIRVLREEFERAAKIMHHDPNPCAKLFEPYVPEDNNNGQGHNQL